MSHTGNYNDNASVQRVAMDMEDTAVTRDYRTEGLVGVEVPRHLFPLRRTRAHANYVVTTGHQALRPDPRLRSRFSDFTVPGRSMWTALHHASIVSLSYNVD